MSAQDAVEFDEAWDVYRIRTAAGVLLGTEYGGLPLGFDSARQAEESIELRAERAAYLRERREARQ